MPLLINDPHLICVPRVLEPVYTAWDMQPFAQDYTATMRLRGK